jgi:hypothetical protein
MVKYFRISLYFREKKPGLIYDFATDPI